MAYVAPDTDSAGEVFFVVGTNPGSATRLSNGAQGDSVYSAVQFDPSGDRVLFVLPGNISNALWVQTIGSSEPALQLNAPVATNPIPSGVLQAQWAPDGSSIAYTVQAMAVGSWDAYVVDPTGAASPQRLHPVLTGSQQVFGIAYAPDSSAIYLQGDVVTPGQPQLVTADPSQPGQVTPTGAGKVNLFRLVPNRDAVVFERLESDGRENLYYFAEGNSPVRINGELPAFGDIQQWAYDDDGGALAYVSDESGEDEAYVVTLEGGGPATPLVASAPLSGGFVSRAELLADDTLVYRADTDGDGSHELYLVDLANPRQAVPLTPPLATGGSVEFGFVVLSDRRSIAYVADHETVGHKHLMVASIDEPGVATQMSPDFPDGGRVYTIRESDDGNWLVYRALTTAAGVTELFAVARSAPRQAILMNAPLTSGSVADYALRPGTP